VLKIPDKDLYIALADRWKPSAFGKWFSKEYYKIVEKALSYGKRSEFTNPDRGPKSVGKLPQKEMRHPENTSIARYVWLPIEWQGEKPVLRWRDE
jgi:hypothetical protein